VGEFASPAWSRSTHVKQIDVALNESCRLITGCLKNIPINKIFPLAGIAPPDIRQGVKANWERTKQKYDKLTSNVWNKPPTHSSEIKEELPKVYTNFGKKSGPRKD